MKRLPKNFQLGSHTFNVKRLAPKEMLRKCEGEEAYGLFVPDELMIYVIKSPTIKASVIMQTFWHEFAHAALWVMNHDDYANETVVDALGHAIHQATSSFQF